MERRAILRGEPEIEQDPGDNLRALARELLRRLRRTADRNVRHALVIALDLQAGYRKAEIIARHALTEGEYKRGYTWVREELARMRAEDSEP